MSAAAAGQKVKFGTPDRTSNQGKSAEPPLLFARHDATLYCSLASLPQRAGVPARHLGKLIAKEFCDNALDAADAAGNPGAVEIEVDESGHLIVTDQGTGIPDATAEGLGALFCVARPMISSKLLRCPSRGAVGNGLRACLGFLTATRGFLIVETGTVRVRLVPQMDGTSQIVSREVVSARRGLRLIAVAVDTPFTSSDLVWARDAIDLAQQSGQPAFTGKPSPHWLDLDHFRVLLSSAVGDVSVRQFLDRLDGCSGSRARTDIAAQFLRRSAASLNEADAAALLVRAQAATKAPKVKALRPLGRDAIPASAGYALASGTFSEGQHAPRAQIPFLVECWAEAFSPEERPDTSLACIPFMNRTRALAPCTGNAWAGHLDISISGTLIHEPAPAGPHYELVLNITSPMFRLTSDGKTPDCQPFRVALKEAVGKAAKQAGREIAALINSEEKRAAAQYRRQQREEEQEQKIEARAERQERQERIEAEKARRRAKPHVNAVVFGMMKDAAELEGECGLPFVPRRIVYRIRDPVLELTGKELTQTYFNGLLTEYEAEHGELHPRMVRSPRGFFYVPHLGLEIPLGTQSVAEFRRQAWTFNKILAIEKDDLRKALQVSGWAERNDCLLMSSIGFYTRAGRDLIDAIAGTTEPVRPYSAHDADAAGTRIQHTLQNATLARGARAIEIIDLGLQPWEGVALGLAKEKVPPTRNRDGTLRRRSVGEYIRKRTDRAPTGETWEEWLQHSRFELNAFTMPQMIAWLDRKLVEHGDGKLVPPSDIVVDHFGEAIRPRARRRVDEAIERQLDERHAAIKARQDEATAEIRAEIDRITAPLRERVAVISSPFEAEMAAATAELDAIDREMQTRQLIDATTPDADVLLSAIGSQLERAPEMQWSAALDEIAERTEIPLNDESGEAFPA